MKKGRAFQWPFSRGRLLPRVSGGDDSGPLFSPPTPPGPFPPPGPQVPPGQPYQPMPRNNPSSSIGMILLGGGCGCLALTGLIVVGFVIWIASLPESGAMPGSQLPTETIEFLYSHDLISHDESVIYYYDATLNMDSSELCFFTSEKIVYYNNGSANKIFWEDVEDIEGASEINFIISVTSDDSRFLKCEIAPFNGGEQFFSALENTWEKMSEAEEEGQ